MRNARIYLNGKLVDLDGYFVDEDGHVYDKDKKIKQYTYRGYKIIEAWLNGKKKRLYVHRIVASTYTDICGEYNEVVNHLDENKFNNSAHNLMFVTNAENLSWGTIKERVREGVDTRKNIINAIKPYCSIDKSPIKIHKFNNYYKVKHHDYVFKIDFGFNIIDSNIDTQNPHSNSDKIVHKQKIHSKLVANEDGSFSSILYDDDGNKIAEICSI